MTITELLAPDQVLPGLRASTKGAVLEDLARRSGIALGLDGDAILAALRKREALGSTGVGNGLAIPHARLDVVGKPFGCFARLRSPIAFDAVDGGAVDLVFLLLLPAAADGAPLHALACVSRRLRDPDVTATVRGARDAAGVYAAICGA